MIESNFEKLINHLRSGDIIAHAAEAVYGLACDAMNGDAARRLLHLKQRPTNKGLIVIAANWAQLKHLIKPIEGSLKQTIDWPAACDLDHPCTG